MCLLAGCLLTCTHAERKARRWTCCFLCAAGGPWFPDYRTTDFAAPWFAHMKEYEATLPKQRLLCPFELFSCKGGKPLEGYPNSGDTWSWDA
jgi:hypothetical protein